MSSHFRSFLLLLVGTAAACSPGATRAPSSTEEILAGPDTSGAQIEQQARAPSRLDPAGAAWVESTLAGMTLRQRIAQLVVPWISGESMAANPQEREWMRRWVAEDEVGGLIVSTGRPAALASKLNEAQRYARVPLLVVSDLETGPGMRLSPGGTDFPPAMAFGAADDTVLAREAGRVTGVEARAVGIHMTLGPVLDVNSNPDNPIINIRSFGEDPERVARLATAWVQGARETGLLSAGKHFPGHGDTEVDSHVGLATIRGDSARLARVELAPFALAVAIGIDGVLVGHIAVEGLEGPGAPPASLSTTVVGDVLRRQLGFDGLVVTDALNMGAITRNYSVGEASIRALQAGVDVLLQPPGARGVIDQIVRAVESGRIPPERVDEAARRVLSTKALAGLHVRAQVPLDSVPQRVGAAAHEAVARSVTRASIALARDQAGIVPFAAPRRRVLHLAYAGSGRTSAGAEISRELTAAGAYVDHVGVGARTSTAEFAALRNRANTADLVIASVSIAPHQYRALELGGEFGRFVEHLAATGRPVVAVSLGSPYVIESFPSVATYLLGWSANRESQRAIARALLGTVPVRGRVPVSLPWPDSSRRGLVR